ncbi:twin transmembrane helix small protein [Ochrobactrum sp. CM-21-5]|uniref:Twin transmembrane helix small protein n=1 Tax=Falsochrobactrum tianjinense TaxID=2706015 RepID=A0A949PL42_9HYPH|nr:MULTISPECIES: twin transmembrane helix small protein [Brucellaceae]MBC2883814.1 twin transmembrane helix small protein [Ochrobactrum sp. CM-21-5]MBV2141909.1 twin transmembrane helix small protein [Falsochrobactrum sp. TDYN1]
MDFLFKGAAMVAMLAVAIVLIIGLRNMMRGGDANFSNKMMQLRVFLQFIAVLLIVGAIYYARQTSGQ